MLMLFWVAHGLKSKTWHLSLQIKLFMGLCDEEAMGFWCRPRVDDRTKSLSSRVQMISELMSLVEDIQSSLIFYTVTIKTLLFYVTCLKMVQMDFFHNDTNGLHFTTLLQTIFSYLKFYSRLFWPNRTTW